MIFNIINSLVGTGTTIVLLPVMDGIVRKGHLGVVGKTELWLSTPPPGGSGVAGKSRTGRAGVGVNTSFIGLTRWEALMLES